MKFETGSIRFSNWQPPDIFDGELTKYNWLVVGREGFALGKNTDIGAFSLIVAGAGVDIQDGAQLGGGVKVYSISTIDGKRGKVTIKEGAKIGANSIIMPGVTVGVGAVVGALSFVNKDIPDGETWAGSPARRLKRKKKQ